MLVKQFKQYIRNKLAKKLEIKTRNPRTNLEVEPRNRSFDIEFRTSNFDFEVRRWILRFDFDFGRKIEILFKNVDQKSS